MKKTYDFDPQSFAVIGAGPVGCIVAAFLAKGGYDVILCDIVPELTEPALAPGIIIEGSESLQQAVMKTCRSVDELAEYAPDVIFLTPKANALPLVISAIEEFYRDGMVVVSWQNGIDTELVIARALGSKPVLRAVVNYGCKLLKPGHVQMMFHHSPHYVQEMDPEARQVAITVANLLSKCGLATEHTDQIESMVWRKTIMNASTNCVCAVTGMTMAQAMNDPFIFKIIDAMFKECIKVARANEIVLGRDYYSYGMEYMRTAGNHKPSMLMDIEMKHRTEVDFMNGKMIEYGEEAGLETPYNATFLALVKALEPK